MHCAMCHNVGGQRRPLDFKGTDPETIAGFLGTLPDLNPDMPPFTGTAAEGHALAVYLSNPSK